jgi:hypothetical protein
MFNRRTNVALAGNEKGFVQVGIWNTKVSIQHKSRLELLLLNLAIQPHLHKTLC